MFEQELMEMAKKLVGEEPVEARTWIGQTWDPTRAQTLRSEVINSLTLQAHSVSSRPIQTTTTHSQAPHASIVAVLGSYSNLGVDVESRHREVHPKVGSRIISESEKQWNLAPLEVWVCKEATFKSNPENHSTLIPEYKIIRWDSQSNRGEVQLPGASQNWTCRVELKFLGDWIFAVALSRSKFD